MARELRFDVSALDRASQVFARMGRAVERFERRLDDLDGKTVDVHVDVDTDQAERKVGSFARETRARLESALRNLPELEIDADSDPAERAIANVRRRLAELSDKTVGIDIGAAEALAETRELQRQLDQIGRSSPNVQVRADAARAAAQLAAINEMVDRVDGRRARIRVDVDRGLDEAVLRMAQLGRTMGTVLPFAAAAAAPPVASLGASVVALSQAMYMIPAAGLAVGAGIATVVIGMNGFSDALKVRGDAEKFAEALKELAPAARAAAITIRDLGSGWSEIQNNIQQNLFSNLAADLQSMSGRYFPILNAGLAGIATQMSAARSEWVRFMSSVEATNSIGLIFGNIIRATMPLGGILSNLTSMFVNIGKVGSDFLPGLANGLERATGRWRDFMAEAANSGQLAEWIQEGIDTIAQLGRIVGDVGSTLNAVFTAAETAGADFLGTLERGTSAMKEWAQSTEGTDTLVKFFTDVRGAVDALLPGLLEMGDAFLDVVRALNDAGAFTAVASALSALMDSAAPVVRILGDLAAAVLPPLAAIIESLAPLLGPVIAAMLALSGAGRLMAAAMHLPASAIKSWKAFQTFGQSLRTTARGARDASGEMTNLGGRVGFLGGRVASTVGAFRQFAGEARVQRALAASMGQEVGRLGGVWAALETSQLRAAETALGLRNAYVNASTSVNSFAQQAGAAAQRVTTAFGNRLAAGVSRGVEGIIRIPGAVADAARALNSGLGYAAIYARESMIRLGEGAVSAAGTLRTGIGVAAINAADAIRRLPAAVSSAAATLRTGLGVAAINAADAVRRIPAAVSSAAATLRTGIGVAAINAADGLRRFGTAAVNAGQVAAQGLRTGAAAAVSAVRQIPAATVTAGAAIGRGIQTGVTTAVNAVRELPGRVVGAVRTMGTQVASAMRVIPTAIQGAFSGLGGIVSGAIGHLGRFSGAVAGMGATIGSGLMRAGGSLVSFLGGPWGVALAVAGTALAAFGAHQADAAAKAAEHQAALDALKGTLDSYSGAITQATINEKANQLAKDGTLDTARQLGISTQDLTRAHLGEAGALERVQGQLANHAAGLISQSSAYDQVAPKLAAYGITLDDIAAASIGNQAAMDKVNTAIGQVARQATDGGAAFGNLVDEMFGAAGEAARLGEELGISNGELAKIQDQTRLAAQASNEFASTLDAIGSGLAALGEGAPMTEQLANGLRSVADSAAETAQRAGEAEGALMGVDAGAIAARNSMQGSRDAFIAAAEGAGMSAEQAGALANQIGLIPAAAETNFRTNAQGVAAEMNTLAAQIDAVPAGKDVTVQAMTAEAEGNLTALGFQVERMKDGTVRVTANTDQARASLEQFIAGSQNREAQVKIGANSMPANQALSAVLQQISAGNGQVTINGNSMPATQALSFVMGAIGSASGEVKIGAQTVSAQSVLQAYISAVNAGQGEVTINGNKIPADQVLQALIAAANGSTGTVKIDGDSSGAQGKVLQVVGLADGSTGTITIDGEPSSAHGKVTTAVAFADGSRGTITVDANQQPANGKIQATVTYADGSTGTVTINANDSAARAAISALQRPTFSTHTIDVITRGNVALARARAEGGYTTPAAYAAGGYRARRMSASRAEIVPARQPRLIGDRQRGDEAFIPVNGSSRSQAILATTAHKMGFDLVKSGKWPPELDALKVKAASAVQARAQSPSLQAAARSGGDVLVARMLSEFQSLRHELSARGVEITNNFAVAELNRAAEAVAMANRRAAALGLFTGGRSAK